MSTNSSTREKFARYGVTTAGVAGLLAGGITRLITAPLDTIKIRFQLQSSSNPRYTSIRRALVDIVKEEGFTALWKGNLCASYLWISYGAVQFTVYDFLKIMNKTTGNYGQFWGSFGAGATAATFAVIFSYPFDLLRTQFVVQGNKKRYTSILAFGKHAWYDCGSLRGLYAGLPAAVLGTAPGMGVTFALYESFTLVTNNFLLPYLNTMKVDGYVDTPDRNIDKNIDRNMKKTNKKQQHWLSSSIGGTISITGICGALSGGVSKMLLYPMDTIKKVCQLQVVELSFVNDNNLYSDIRGIGIGSNGVDNMIGNTTNNTNNQLNQSYQLNNRQTDIISSSGRSQRIYSSSVLIRSIRHIWERERGIRGFYKGVAPAILKAVVSAGVMFATFETIKLQLDTLFIYYLNNKLLDVLNRRSILKVKPRREKEQK